MYFDIERRTRLPLGYSSVADAMDVVDLLRARLLPALRVGADRVRASSPDVVVSVWERSEGSGPDRRGHELGLECLVDGGPDDQSDVVALTVGVSHLDSVPLLCSADVAWDHPEGRVEASLLAAPILCSVTALDDVVGRLPELLRAMTLAVERGRPAAPAADGLGSGRR